MERLLGEAPPHLSYAWSHALSPLYSRVTSSCAASYTSSIDPRLSSILILTALASYAHNDRRSAILLTKRLLWQADCRRWDRGYRYRRHRVLPPSLPLLCVLHPRPASQSRGCASDHQRRVRLALAQEQRRNSRRRRGGVRKPTAWVEQQRWRCLRWAEHGRRWVPAAAWCATSECQRRRSGHAAASVRTEAERVCSTPWIPTSGAYETLSALMLQLSPPLFVDGSRYPVMFLFSLTLADAVEPSIQYNV